MELPSGRPSAAKLQNVIERAVILTTGSVLQISSDDLEAPNNVAQNPAQAGALSVPGGSSSLESFEKDFILQALRKYGGNQTRTAHYLGLTRRILAYRLEKYGIHRGARKAMKQKATA
jgi:DNA-binding NtrC family response regulator